jgi:peptide/nickel transport system substrate-binding protein
LKALKFPLCGLILTLLAVSCGKTGTSTENAGTILASAISDPKSFNYITAREVSTTDVLGFVYEGLVRTDGKTYETEPSLAESWSVSSDSTTWTFNLRRDVVWSDGEPFTARDVVFTYNDLIFNEKVAAGMRDLLQVDGKVFEVKMIDSWTVTINTHKPFAPFLRTIGSGILPWHKHASVEDFNQALGINTPLQEIVGTGPFMVTEFTPGQRVVLEANPRYWQKDEHGKPLPRTKKLIIYTVPDLDAEIEWFKSGRTDFVGVRGADWPVLAANHSGYTMRNMGPRFSSTYITFNQNTGASIPNERKAWFRNRGFREAVAWAIDRGTIVEGIYNSLAFAQHSPIPEANKLFYDSGITHYTYDLKKAEKLLEEAGFRKNEKGELLDEKGNRVAFEIMTNAGNNERVRSATVIADGLRKLGMDARVNAMDFNALVDRLDNDLNWEACVLGLTSSLDPHNGANIWRVEGDLHMFNQKPRKPPEDASAAANRKYQKDLAAWRAGVQPWEREIEGIFEEGASELDPAKRFALYSRFQRLVSRELPFIYTVSPAALYATRDRIEGVDPSPIGSTTLGAVLHNVEFLVAR